MRCGLKRRLRRQGKGEEKGYPGNRLPLCMGESSGEETPLTWRGGVVCMCVCAKHATAQIYVFFFCILFIRLKIETWQTLHLAKTQSMSSLFLSCRFSLSLDAMQLLRSELRKAFFASAVRLGHTKLVYVWKVIFNSTFIKSLTHTETISFIWKKAFRFW